MAKRRAPVPPRAESVDTGDPFAPPEPPDLPETAAEAEAARKDPLAPGEGNARPATPVNLSSTEINQLAQEFASEIELQQSAQEQIRYDWQRWLKTYRGRPLFDNKDYPLAHASNVTVRLAGIFTDQVVARIYQGIVGPQPHWLVVELNKRYAAACKPYERYLNWSAAHLWNQERVVKLFVEDVVKLGTGVIYDDWVSETMWRYDDRTKQTVQTGSRHHPMPRWIPREDFLQPIGFADPQTAPYCGHRAWFTWDKLERMAHDGIIVNLDKLRGNSDEEDDIRLERRRNRDEMVDGSQDDRFGIWSPYYVWFRRDLDNDGWPEEYVMLLHVDTATPMLLVANPSISGTRPYATSRFIEIEGEFDGMGIPEQVDSLQEEISTIHNQRRDRAHLANIVMYKGRAAGNLPDSIRPESGKVIKVLDPNDLVEFHPMTNVPIDIAEENFVMKLAELTVGMNDISLGKESSPVGRAAATTVMALMQEGSRRFDLNVADIRAALTEEGNQVTELWQIYGLPKPDEAGSPEQVLDPEEAILVRQLLEQPEALRGLVAIKLNVATAAVNREVEKQSNFQLLGVIDQYVQQILQLTPFFTNPQVPPEVRAIVVKSVEAKDAVLTKIFQSHDAFDLESVLVGDVIAEMNQKADQAQQAMAQQQAAMGPMAAQGQPPQALPGQAPQQALPAPGQGQVIPMRRQQ